MWIVCVHRTVPRLSRTTHRVPLLDMAATLHLILRIKIAVVSERKTRRLVLFAMLYMTTWRGKALTSLPLSTSRKAKTKARWWMARLFASLPPTNSNRVKLSWNRRNSRSKDLMMWFVRVRTRCTSPKMWKICSMIAFTWRNLRLASWKTTTRSMIPKMLTNGAVSI